MPPEKTVHVRPATVVETQAMLVWGQRALESCRAHNAGTLDPEAPPAFTAIFALANQMLPTGHMIPFGSEGFACPETVTGPHSKLMMGSLMLLAHAARDLLLAHTSEPKFNGCQLGEHQSIELVEEYELGLLAAAVDVFAHDMEDADIPQYQEPATSVIQDHSAGQSQMTPKPGDSYVVGE